jgi:hypothetical protein
MLVNCKECKKEISDESKICVHCGSTLPVELNWFGNLLNSIGNIFYLIGMIILGWLCLKLIF